MNGGRFGCKLIIAFVEFATENKTRRGKKMRIEHFTSTVITGWIKMTEVVAT